MTDSAFNVMVVDDDFEYAQTCVRTLERADFQATPVDSATTGLRMIRERGCYCLVLTDLQMPDMDGIEFLRSIKESAPSTEVIIMTGYGTIESAVEAIKSGALEYITKPFNKDELLNAVQKVYKVWKLEREVRHLKKLVTDELQLTGFVFQNNLMTTVYKRMSAAARCNCSVFISGESGTGKELVARAIHANSSRADGPFIPVNCSAISSSLIESELFGYRKGAFTGAEKDYDGLFVAANGGTLFLDEIAEMERGTQSKLLRSIQDHTVRPVGALEERAIDVRFIAATNKKISDALSRRLLREDLYHRLNVISIDVPPLRKMKSDIASLFEYLLVHKGEEHNKRNRRFDKHALDALADYGWPGNVREACNVVEQCLVNSEGETIRAVDLPQQIGSRKSAGSRDGAVPTFDEAERDLVVRALRQAKGNKSQAAEMLGISRPRLYKKIDDYDINEV